MYALMACATIAQPGNDVQHMCAAISGMQPTVHFLVMNLKRAAVCTLIQVLAMPTCSL
jgi:hypothetical protein